MLTSKRSTTARTRSYRKKNTRGLTSKPRGSRVTTEWIQADRPGRFRGQCAEFCGLQHAHMALWVIAQSPQDFNAWYTRQLEPSREPPNETATQGREVFLNHACVLCHAIRGTPAAGTNGPDLTHFGSRRTIAAGTLLFDQDSLTRWIQDPQSIKPGNHMPAIQLSDVELERLTSYLETLE